MDEAVAVVDEQGTELAIPQESQVAKYVNDDNFDKLVTTYLPRLQLYDSNSNAVKQGTIQIGTYGLATANNITSLGKEAKLFVCSMRFKAMDLNGGVKSFYNPDHKEFLRIKKTSEGQNTGCLCGPEFLVFLPDINKFATFFMSSKTMRREAPNVRALIGKGCLLRTRLIEKKPYTWFGPIATPYTSPMKLPDAINLQAELDGFNNPPEEEIEAVEGTAPERER